MAVPKKPSADDNLATENYQELNRAFYAAKPSDYFSQRLENLMLVAGRHEDLDQLTSEGITYRGLKAGGDGQPGGTNDDPESQGAGKPFDAAERAKSAEHFVIAEAETLSQHVGETLLRLYLAHTYGDGERPPPCPWLDISRLRSFSKAKEVVRAHFGPDTNPEDAARLRAIARVFHLTDNPEGLTEHPIPIEQWRRSLTTIEGYLRGFAEQFLDRAPLYNAAKHGLALLPGEMSMKLDDGALIRADGPSIRYLEIRDDSGGAPRWYQNNHWVRPDRQMALIYRATQLIEMLWEIAKLRYVPETRPERMRIRMFSGPSWFDLYTSGAEDTGGIVIEDMAMELLYYEATAAAEERATREAGASADEAVMPPDQDDVDV